MTTLPRSARWAAWFGAWVDGFVPLDDAVDAVLDSDAAHDVTGLLDEPVRLGAAWLELRRRGASGASAALPSPGDPLGLAGPADFNEQALDAGEAVVMHGIGTGFVPTVVGRGVFWTAHTAAAPIASDSLAEAERRLREQLIETGHELAALDVARWRPEVAEALASLREARDGALPAGFDDRTQRVAALAGRCLRIGDLALADDGAALTADKGVQRRRSIELLCRAARHAMVVSCTREPSR